VIGRGLERRFIFDAEADKENFLTRLGDNLARCQAQCLAWAMMSNHYHLLIRVSHRPLPELMAPLLGGYAGYYNRKYHRSGYVFQNRYQSILCDADTYLKVLVRYIHLNPVQAGMVENTQALERYRWTGHAGAFGRYRQRWHEVEEMLGIFGNRLGVARKKYREFISEEQDDQPDRLLSGGGLIRSSGGWEQLSRLRREHVCCIGDERILGDSNFVEQALKQDELAVDLKSDLERAGWTLDKLITKVCQLYDVDEQGLLTKTRQKNASTAKSLICYWGTAVLGLMAKDIGTRLQLSHPAVSYRAKAGRQYCESNEIEFEESMR